jgi:hypothetical protein
MSKIFTRAIGATILRGESYRAAYFDGDAPADGAILVSLVAAVSYVGGLIYLGLFGAFDFRALLQVVIAAVASWLILAFATWGTSTWLFNASARPQIMIGVHGITVLPLLLDIFQNQVLGAVGLVWYLGLLTVATREVTSLDWKKSGVSVLIGLAAAVLIRAILNVPFAAFGSILG